MNNKFSVALTALSIIGVLVAGCSGSGKKETNAKEPTAQHQQDTKPGILKFKKQTIIDKEGTGKEALTFLMPEGWKMEGGIHWNVNDVQLPATCAVKISEPSGDVAFQGFPNMVFLVSSDPDFNDQYPAGSKLYAARVLNVKPTVFDLMKNFVINEYRNIPGLKITEQKELSTAEATHSQQKEYAKLDNSSGVISIVYKQGGKTYEENIYGTLSKVPVAQGVEYDYLSLCYGCRAPEKQLKDHMGIFETMLNSVRVNPKWNAAFTMVSSQLMKRAFASNYQNQGGYNDYGNTGYGDNGMNGGGNYGDNGGGYAGNNNFGSLSQYISEANNSISNSNMSAYENQQRSEDRVFENYSDYMLDYQNYKDPNSGDYYKLPSGYDNAWIDNNSGEYILSNQSGYDPNVGSTSSYTPLETTTSSYDAGGGDQ